MVYLFDGVQYFYLHILNKISYTTCKGEETVL